MKKKILSLIMAGVAFSSLAFVGGCNNDNVEKVVEEEGFVMPQVE